MCIHHSFSDALHVAFSAADSAAISIEFQFLNAEGVRIRGEGKKVVG